MSRPAVYRSVVLGLDGIPWRLLEQWGRAGSLPNIQQLLERGACGPLESTIPPTSAVSWPSIASGVRPDKHGIYGVRRLTRSYDSELNSSAHVRQPPVWKMITPAIVVNVPATYPAEEIDGTMVTGMLTPHRDAGFTHPRTLGNAIDEEFPEYRIGPTLTSDLTRPYTEEIERVVGARRDLVRSFMDDSQWGLVFAVFTGPDRLQHVVWDEHELLSHYQTIDEIIGEMMSHVADRNGNLFVVSSHGFGPSARTVHLNTLLEHGGFLRDEADSRTASRRSKQSADRVNSFTTGDSRGSTPTVCMDHANTRVFGHSTRNIYVNDTIRFDDGIVPPSSRADEKRRVMTFFESVVCPDTGDPLLRVYDGTDLYPTDPLAPDVIIEAARGADISTERADEPIQAHETGGAHRSNGAILAWGPNICQRPLEDATVYDVAPTLLHSQLHPIPNNVDGRVLDIFQTDSAPGARSPTYMHVRGGPQPIDRSRSIRESTRVQGLTHFE